MPGAIPHSVRPVVVAFRTSALVAAFAVAAIPLQGQSLRGSPASLDVQNRTARDHDFTFLRTATEVRRFVNGGYLVPVRGNRDFDLHAVSFPYARPEAALFVERLASQYYSRCGEKLVVTSLTRPTSGQPRNASSRSVHPTGMAVDLRLSNVRACREWLEGALLELERAGVVEATRERYPPHYHVAVFPQPYSQYVSRVAEAPTRADEGAFRMAASNPAPARSAERTAAQVADLVPYEVRRGDSLWGIARKYDTTVDRLRAENGLRTSRIYAGQVLDVPVSR